ncbi:hypothetical protein [Prosthecobacter sp.]|uniref:hypothetical protein n=1 Tax=Prosthecobacter sp. TaxID=1965333 RepID=UPI001D257278|nr:hypothetical protein [Prosthecobacter sp.]MCB1279872.1 hypothetical protein [Prosthecobacter sp.]
MKTTFTKLNDGWNAEPNAPGPKVSWDGSDLILRFYLNPFQFPQFDEEDIGIIRFENCTRYRFGTVNDEGWYRGQCRFSKTAPSWGEFYEISGDLKLDHLKDNWIIRSLDQSNQHHYLFYFRDEEFECDAAGWKLEIEKASPNNNL